MKENKQDGNAPDATSQEQKPVNGKNAFIEMLKAGNPDYSPENDDQVWKDALDMHNNVAGQLSQFKKSSDSLSKGIANDPRMGAVLSIVHGEKPKSFGYAVGRVYGRSVYENEPDEFEKGEQEKIKEISESKAMQEKAAKNAEESISKVNKWASDNDLSTEETSALKDKIYELADNFLMGIFGEDIAEFVYKGLNHDKNVQQAADTGYVQGKNERIDIKKKDMQQSPIPNMRSQSDAIPIPKFNNVKQKDDLYRTVKSIPGTARRK